MTPLIPTHLSPQRHCICAKLPQLTLPVDFAVLLHYKEYLRISNTGHLLPLMHKYDPATNTYVSRCTLLGRACHVCACVIDPTHTLLS